MFDKSIDFNNQIIDQFKCVYKLACNDNKENENNIKNHLAYNLKLLDSISIKFNQFKAVFND